jgi:MoaA/NifB/PqqE/SkfB family radical SAM enzyme
MMVSQEMKAVVIQPPLLLSRDFIDYPYFTSLGSAQAAAILREKGWEVTVLDGMARSGADLWEEGGEAWLGEAREKFLKRALGLDADLAVINGSPFLIGFPGRRWLEELVAALSGGKASLLVLADMYVGGMHYLEYDGGKLLEQLAGLDLVLRYEGEPLLGRLADSLQANNQPPRGVWENREAFPLDDLPPPAFDLMDLEAYFGFLYRVLSCEWRPGPIQADPARTLPLITSRGCPFGCIFCSRNPGLPGDRRQVRPIPWERVEEWIRRWVKSHGLQRLIVLDEVANLDSGRFESLLTLLEELGLRVDFPNGLRADLLEEQHVRRLAGLTSAFKVSLESASPRVQREVLKKNLDPSAVSRTAEWARRAGIPLQVHCLIGIPGETRAEIVQTVRMAVRLFEEHGARPLVQFATPLPGTELDDICCKEGLVSEQPEDLHACFQGRSLVHTGDFDPAFLQQAADVLAGKLDDQAQRKVIVNLTYRCNNHCVFCAVGDRPQRDADPEEVMAAIERHRREGFELLDIDGGEPTLHPQLFAIIAEARRLGFSKISLTTNGRRLSYPGFASKLAASGLDEILVSLHAPDAGLQQRLTSDPDSFGQTTRGLENILTVMRDPEAVGVNTTIIGENLPAIRRLGEMLASLGVKRWNLQVVTPFGRARASQLPDAEELKKTLLDLLGDPPGPMRIQVINCPPCMLPGFEEVAAVDFMKAQRDMIFVGDQGVNLQGFLASRRRQDERCRDCLYSIVCPGFYCFDHTDEPLYGE